MFALMADQSGIIAEFCALTGAAPHIAEHYLGAHDWDIQRASDFFFEHPPDDAEDLHAVHGHRAESPPPLDGAFQQPVSHAAAGPGARPLGHIQSGKVP